MQPTNLPEVIEYIAKQQQEKLAADIADAYLAATPASLPFGSSARSTCRKTRLFGLRS
jgi:hypothetical protein